MSKIDFNVTDNVLKDRYFVRDIRVHKLRHNGVKNSGGLNI